MSAAVTVEEVTAGKGLARFTELPHALDGGDPRFVPLVLAWERYRLDRRRNPWFDEGEAAFFLARRRGRPAGRIAAHLTGPEGAGRFGFWWLEDDGAVADALIDAARGWLAERGCSAMTGPVSFVEGEDDGVLIAGLDVPGTTGRPWHPPHLARLLAERGGTPVGDHPRWRLATAHEGPASPPSRGRTSETGPAGQAGAYGDPRLVLPGITAVPDVAPALRGPGGARTALRLAQRARRAEWETATVVGVVEDPATAVPALVAAAGRAGYRWVVSPWAPDRDKPPETVHRVLQLCW